MKKLSKKQYLITLSGVIVLFLGVLFYISQPYIKNWRSQYSSKLESTADLNPDKQKALLQYREADFLSDHESLSLKIGKLYDDTGKPELAEKYFSKVKSENYLNDLTEHYLKNGNIEKAKSIVQKSNDEYYNTLILFINDPKEAAQKNKDTQDSKTKELKQYIETFINNPQKEYNDTAIALYLYKNGYTNLALQKLEPYLNKDYKDAFVLIGDIYYKNGLYNISATAYEKSIALDKYDLEAYKKLGEVYQKLENKEKLAEISVIIDRLEINPK